MPKTKKKVIRKTKKKTVVPLYALKHNAEMLEPLAEEARLTSKYSKNPKFCEKYFVDNTIKSQQHFKEASEKHAKSFAHFGYGLAYSPYHYGLNFADKEELNDFYNRAVKKSAPTKAKPKKTQTKQKGKKKKQTSIFNGFV